MGDRLGGPPLLFALMLNNQNNNQLYDNDKGFPQAGTVVLEDHVAEVDHPSKFIPRCEANHSLNAVVAQLRAAQKPHLQGLTKAQSGFYNMNGYLVLPDALAANEATVLLEEAHHVMKGIAAGGDGIIQHVLSGTSKKPSPIGRVLATFETEASTASEPLRRPIARLGCGIHQLMPSFHTITHSAFHRSIAESLGYNTPHITQSQLIAKPAGTGREVYAHQDSCVSFTNPPSGLTFWYALEDATVENGCLCVARGSHLTEPVRQRLVKGDNGEPKFKALKAPLWARGACSTAKEFKWMEYKYEPLEVKKGSLVLFHGNLMHRSAKNQSEKSRMSYVFSIIDGNMECPDDSYMKPVGSNFDLL